VNGDVWTDIDFGALRRLPPRGSHAHLVLVPNPPQHMRGDFLLSDGYIADGEGTRYTYSGIGIYTSAMFAGSTAGKFPLLPLLRQAISARALTGELHEGQWYDVGTIERLNALDAQLSRIAQVT
jgi:MurNAc alpha-1-phosphate uridylyltransferase